MRPRPRPTPVPFHPRVLQAGRTAVRPYNHDTHCRHDTHRGNDSHRPPGAVVMTYDPNRHHRRSPRLLGYDYTAAATYFLTLCTKGRAHLFGDVVAGDVTLNECGHIVREEWHRSAVYY